MAKEVDLSSREWCDLVFEGKNKDFGAYVIRTESTKRHNLAVLWTVLGAIVLGALVFGLVGLNNYLEEQRRLAGEQDQSEVLIDMSQDTEEPEPEQQRVEPEKPILKEEVLQSVKVTELAIVKDEEVRKED